MGAERKSVACQRARAQISLDLDGCLSEFERRLLVAHLERCVDCRLYEGDVAAFTDVLRGAPPEQAERAIVVRRPRRLQPMRLGLRAAAVALPVIAAVLVGRGALTTSLAERTPTLAPTTYPTTRELTREVQSVLNGPRANDFEGIRGTQQSI